MFQRKDAKTMSDAALEFKQVSKSYGGGGFVLNQFDLTVPKGRIVTLIGPSGCGKTTILKLINRLIEPESGSILLEGTDIGSLDPVELRRNIGYVIQQIGLFPHMTIEDNISLVPRLKGESKKALVGKVEELLRLIGLEPEQYRKRYPHELSGGQQQRIGVARALAANPSIILMDEPFSALDPISRIQLQKELIYLNKQVKKTIVFVTHDIDEALKIADHIILLKDGAIVQAASPEQLLQSPANDFVREFIGADRFRAEEVQRTAHDVMEDAVSIGQQASIADVLEQLGRNQISNLVVTSQENSVVGIIGFEQLRYSNESAAHSTRVKQITKDVPTVQKHTPLDKLSGLLAEHPIIPVVDESHKLCGIVTQAGFIKKIGLSRERGEVVL
ncbi:betaine/proline/choline family ABC transporter ATP-binding protein [Paenibacillus sp. GCM10012307]|uniref:Quaternary amine transport ATP-binding protein n=1 Tax=Paenibacillus roseus TaxID=2798579 RepID=A0A934IV63_9BACL|nr:betaine/proline/choline family ABC transporter ATP-binding protein [Paenibacillus roseus]MBJ6359912.1 betaine/proline/choline family ABC transporter ATP-binding protein [Paenibacillus roseus]